MSISAWERHIFGFSHLCDWNIRVFVGYFLTKHPSPQHPGEATPAALWAIHVPFSVPHTVVGCHLQSLSTLLFQKQQRLGGEARSWDPHHRINGHPYVDTVTYFYKLQYIFIFIYGGFHGWGYPKMAGLQGKILLKWFKMDDLGGTPI